MVSVRTLLHSRREKSFDSQKKRILARPSMRSRRSETPGISPSTRPESWKLKVWSKSLINRCCPEIEFDKIIPLILFYVELFPTCVRERGRTGGAQNLLQ